MDERRAVVKKSDMSDKMVNEAIQLAVEAIDRSDNAAQITDYIKKEFDRRHERTWHCIVGKNYASSVTQAENSLIQFKLDDYTILLYKWG